MTEWDSTWLTWLEGFSINLEWDAALNMWVAEGTNGDVSFSGAAEHPIAAFAEWWMRAAGVFNVGEAQGEEQVVQEGE